MVIEYNDYGRQGIGVAQPASGIDYPFVSPSDEIRYLVADFFLSYEDPATFAEGDAHVRPFKLAWLYGIGDQVVTPPDGAPTPTHAADLLITDVNDQVVFDSTLATFFDSRDWGPAYHIYEWRDAYQVCRLVVHTHWQSTDDQEPREYDDHIVPTDGILDDRTLACLPKRVRSVTVLSTTFSDEVNVDLAAGNNIQIAVADPTDVPGTRCETVLTINAVPNAGTGRYNDCDDRVTYVSRINGVGADAAGRLLLGATDCYYFRRPMSIVQLSPRRSAPSILTNPLAGHLKFGNDCGVCCSCDEMVATAVWMNDLRNQYATIGTDLQTGYETYLENRVRWLEALECRKAHPLQLAILAQSGPYIDVVGQFGNQTPDCLADLELIFTGSTVPSIVGDVTVVPGSTRIWETVPQQSSPYVMAADGLAMHAYWDSVQSFAPAKVQFRLKFPGDGLAPGDVPYNVTVVLTGKLGGVPLTYNAVPISVTMTATLNASAE